MNCHPFAPKEYVQGYLHLVKDLGNKLKEIIGLDAVSFQSNLCNGKIHCFTLY